MTEFNSFVGLSSVYFFKKIFPFTILLNDFSKYILGRVILKENRGDGFEATGLFPSSISVSDHLNAYS